ncbi:MAG: RNA polymerase sigma factor [Bacteroidetes bacterium]|nr:RNA polymerase sigma factor [Bacteroidota bacterium]
MNKYGTTAGYFTGMEEAELIEGCIRNSRAAQKRLYDNYCDAMFSIAFRITGDEGFAADALQESFINIFREIKHLRNRQALASWIKSIVIRTSLKVVRKYKRIQFTDDPINGHPVEWPEPMRGEDLERAILSLPEGYRLVFLLVEVEGYKHQEVATMLGISEGTSKSQLYHSKRYLQRLLKGDWI